MKFILSIFLTGLVSLANSQDYIITQKMDTLRGDVRTLTYGNIDRAEVTSPEGKKHFTAIQVKTVFHDGVVYNPVRTENGYRMMKLVSTGFLSLYLGRVPNGFEYDTEYLVKRDGSSIEIPNLSFKKVVSTFLRECDDLGDRIKRNEFSRKDINKLISEYNNCLDSQTKKANLVSSAALEDPTLIAVNTLKGKIENSSISSKADAIDVLTDIGGKVANGQPIPNYLIESFRSFFKDSPELMPEVESLLDKLKK